MNDAANRLGFKEAAWQSAVRVSAGILIRDHGDGALIQARFLIIQAEMDNNERAVSFWRAVHDVIDNGSHRLDQ